MTPQPRDLAAELQQIISADAQFSDAEIEAAITSRLLRQRRTLLQHIAALSLELEELRKPLEQSDWRIPMFAAEPPSLRRQAEHESHETASVSLRMAADSIDALLGMLDTSARQLRERVEMLEAAQGKLEMMTAYRDRLQAKEQSILDLIGKCDHYRAEITRLSSPPQERAEILERQADRRKLEGPYRTLIMEDLDTLLGDCAAWRNAHALVTAERDQLKAAKLQHDTEQRAAALALHDERIEQLKGALKMVLALLTISDTGLSKEQQADVDAALSASQQHTAGSGDGVAGD